MIGRIKRVLLFFFLKGRIQAKDFFPSKSKWFFFSSAVKKKKKGVGKTAAQRS